MGRVVFLEGETEERMILWFHRNYRVGCEIFTNLRNFRESPNPQKILILTCNGCGDVLPTADRYKFLLGEGNHGKIIRDLEEDSCFTESTVLTQIREACNEYLVQPEKATLLAKPYFETVYAADPDLFRRVFEAQVSSLGGDTNKIDELIMSIDWEKPNFKKLFGTLELAYKKPAFADRFFSQFDFGSSTYPYFLRLNQIFP